MDYNVKLLYLCLIPVNIRSQFNPASENSYHYLSVPTCKNQRPPSCGPSLPGKCQYWTRREHPPSASPVRPAVPAAFGRWTCSLSAPGRQSPTGPGSPPLSGLRLGRCLTPVHSQDITGLSWDTFLVFFIGLWERRVIAQQLNSPVSPPLIRCGWHDGGSTPSDWLRHSTPHFHRSLQRSQH